MSIKYCYTIIVRSMLTHTGSSCQPWTASEQTAVLQQAEPTGACSQRVLHLHYTTAATIRHGAAAGLRTRCHPLLASLLSRRARAHWPSSPRWRTARGSPACPGAPCCPAAARLDTEQSQETCLQSAPSRALPHTRPHTSNTHAKSSSLLPPTLQPGWIDGEQGSRTITARSGVSAHLSINAVLRQAALALPHDVVLPRVLREAPVANANERGYICRRCDIHLLSSDSCWSQRPHARVAALQHQRIGNGIKHACCRRPPFSRCPASPGDVCKKAAVKRQLTRTSCGSPRSSGARGT